MRGQITLIILVAIIVLVVFGLLFSVPQPEIQPPVITPESQQVASYVQSCVDLAAEQAVLKAGMQGGLAIDTPISPSLEFNGFIVPFWKWDEWDIIPTWQEVERIHLATQMELDLIDCLDFSIFDYDVDYSSIDVWAKIHEDLVFMSVSMPITIKSGDKEIQFERPYYAQVPVRLGKLMDLAEEFIESEYDGMVDVSLLTRSALEYNLTINVIPYDENSWFYVIHDDESFLADLPYTLQLASGVIE